MRDAGCGTSETWEVTRTTLFPLPSSLFPLPSSLFPLPSSLFPLPSSLFPLPSSLSPLPSSLFPLPSSLFPLPSSLCPLPAQPLQVNRIGCRERHLVREQKHVGSPPVRDGVERGEHPLHALRGRRHRQNAKVFQSEIVH